jgi:hypothetical protein
MFETYITNRGITKTVLQNNNEKKTNELKWDTDYDGNVANVSLNLNKNGSHKDYHFSLNNDDLANILNIDSVNLPLDKRLKKDFKNQPQVFQIELDNIDKLPYYNSSPVLQDDISEDIFDPIESIRNNISIEPNNYLPSPQMNEEFIIPLTIDENTHPKFTFTSSQKHKKPKSHKTYKVYKHKKTSSHKSKSKRSSKRSGKRSGSMFSLL